MQENVVPLITVKLQNEQKQQQFNVELKYKGKATGIVYTRRPLIDINLHQDDLFAEDVNIRMVVKDANGNVIGSPCDKFYDEVTQLVHIPSGVTQARQTISVNEEYAGDSIVVTALDANTNATLSTLKLNFENDL